MDRRSFFAAVLALVGLSGCKSTPARRQPKPVGMVIPFRKIPEGHVVGDYAFHLQQVVIRDDLKREELFELGRKGPYRRYVSFPVETKEPIA